MLSDENVQRYAKALYPLAFLLILVPLGDITLRSFAAEAGSLQWRFGLVGILFGNMGTISLGIGLVGLVAVLAGHRGSLRGLGFGAILFAVALLALMALFSLDALQMRRLVPIAAKRQITLSAAGALGSALLGMVAMLSIARGALTASRAERASAERRSRPAPSPLVGSQSTAGSVAAPRPRASEPV